jgi:hypothetical protein
MTRKVKVGRTYVFSPVLIDVINPPYNVRKGDVVRVVNLPGCPRANTMGHCHVQHLDGTFAGLVCCNSLTDVLIANDGSVHIREQKVGPTYEQLKARIAKLEQKAK